MEIIKKTLNGVAQFMAAFVAFFICAAIVVLPPMWLFDLNWPGF